MKKHIIRQLLTIKQSNVHTELQKFAGEKCSDFHLSKYLKKKRDNTVIKRHKYVGLIKN